MILLRTLTNRVHSLSPCASPSTYRSAPVFGRANTWHLFSSGRIANLPKLPVATPQIEPWPSGKPVGDKERRFAISSTVVPTRSLSAKFSPLTVQLTGAVSGFGSERQCLGVRAEQSHGRGQRQHGRRLWTILRRQYRPRGLAGAGHSGRR